MQLYAYDIPCKCRFDLLQTTLQHVRAGAGVKELARATGQHLRHAFLLLQNAAILGLIKKEGEFWVLTSSGIRYLESEEEEREEILARSIRNCRFASILIDESGSLEKASRLTINKIADTLRAHCLVSRDRQEPISMTTAKRRASTVKRWIERLMKSESSTETSPLHDFF